MPQDALALRYGSLDMLILRALGGEALHGYGVSSWIRQRTAGVIDIVDAALYKALHRLERQELIEGEWGTTEENRRAKFYKLTAAGRKALREETGSWQQYVHAVQKVLKPA